MSVDLDPCVKEHTGFPKFKKKKSVNSISISQHFKIIDDHLKIPKLKSLIIKEYFLKVAINYFNFFNSFKAVEFVTSSSVFEIIFFRRSYFLHICPERLNSVLDDVVDNPKRSNNNHFLAIFLFKIVNNFLCVGI